MYGPPYPKACSTSLHLQLEQLMVVLLQEGHCHGHGHCVEPDFKINDGRWMVVGRLIMAEDGMSNNSMVRWSFVVSGRTACSEGKEWGIFCGRWWIPLQ